MDHMQITCISLQTDNYHPCLHLTITQILTGQMHFMTPKQQCQTSEGTKIKLRSVNYILRES